MALQAFGPDNEVAPAPSLMGSLEAGAQLGTTLRGQDIAQNEAKDRLSLAYAQLQSQEERAAEQAQAKLTLAHATLQAKQQHDEDLMSYREQSLKQQQEHYQNLAAQSAANLDYKQQSGAQMMDLRERRFADLQDYRQGLNTEQEKRNAIQEKNYALHEALALAKGGGLSEPDKAEMGSDIADLKRTQKEIDAAQPSGPLGTFVHTLMNPTEGWVNPGAEKIVQLKEDALKLRQKIHSYKARELKLPSSSAPTAAGPAAAAAATPYKEGALIRNKETGKLFRVTNGVPVPESEQEPAED